MGIHVHVHVTNIKLPFILAPPSSQSETSPDTTVTVFPAIVSEL